MTITKPARNAEAFIAAAPDAAAPDSTAPKRLMKGKQEQFSHTMPPELRQQLDAFAAKHKLKRAPAINLAVRQMLQQGIIITLDPVEQDGQS